MPKKKLPPAIDIDSHSVKLMQLAQDSKGQLEIIALDEQVYKVNSAQKTLDYQKEALKKLTARNNVGKKCIIGLSTSDVHIYNMTFPLMLDTELKSALIYKLIQAKPFGLDIRDLNYNFLKLTGQNIGVGPSKVYRLLVVCTPSSLIGRKLGLLRSAGLKPILIEVNPVNLVNLGRYFDWYKGISLWLLLGWQASSLVIEKNQMVLFIRGVDFALDNLDQAISKSLNVDIDEARDLRKKYGLSYWSELKEDKPYLESDTSGGSEEISAKVYRAISSHLENLIVNIQHSFKYFSYQITQSQITKFDRLIITGYDANLKNLTRFLASRLGVSTEIVNPLSMFKLSKKAAKSGNALVTSGANFAVCSALSISTIIDKFRHINLLMPKNRIVHKVLMDIVSKNRRAKIAGGVISLVLIITSFQAVNFYQSKGQMESISKQLRKTKAKFSRLTASQLALSQEETKISDAKAKLEIQLNRLKGGLRTPDNFSQLFLIIAESMPKDLHISKLSYKDRKLNIAGSTPNVNGVVDFVEILKKKKQFGGASFVYSRKGDKGQLYDFEVTAQIRK